MLTSFGASEFLLDCCQVFIWFRNAAQLPYHDIKPHLALLFRLGGVFDALAVYGGSRGSCDNPCFFAQEVHYRLGGEVCFSIGRSCTSAQIQSLQPLGPCGKFFSLQCIYL